MVATAAPKKMLSVEDIESLPVLELPDRETPVTVVIGCIGVCVGQLRINVEDVNVAAQICAAVQALNVSLLSIVNAQLTCVIRQH